MILESYFIAEAVRAISSVINPSRTLRPEIHVKRSENGTSAIKWKYMNL
jgi:hypothetical protein